MLLKDYISVAVKYLKFLIIFTVLAGTIGYVYSAFFIQPKYTSRASVIILTKDTIINNTTEISIINSYIKDYLVLFTRKSVKTQAAQSIGSQYSEFAGVSMSVSQVSDSRILEISVTTSAAEKAAEIANAMVTTFRTVVMEKLEVQNVIIFEKAETGLRTSPDVTKNAAVTALAGLVLTYGACLLITMLDNTIKTADDVKEYLDIPVLAKFAKLENLSAAKGFSFPVED
ncbi:MAG: hypothetical protein LBQ48_04850 [Oscillospiraceae bacterium]|jgi:capsular polysaccharide biosynthesis protein|nr:hypothetical protein [Oscillospiraceae bacterium]